MANCVLFDEGAIRRRSRLWPTATENQILGAQGLQKAESPEGEIRCLPDCAKLACAREWPQSL